MAVGDDSFCMPADTPNTMPSSTNIITHMNQRLVSANCWKVGLDAQKNDTKAVTNRAKVILRYTFFIADDTIDCTVVPLL